MSVVKPTTLEQNLRWSTGEADSSAEAWRKAAHLCCTDSHPDPRTAGGNACQEKALQIRWVSWARRERRGC
eukprot:11086672-Alexandrium_andersonii.AAC.1